MKAKEIEQKVWDFFGGKSAAMAALANMTPEASARLKAGIAADLQGKSAMEAAGMKKPAETPAAGTTPSAADLNGGTMYTPVDGARTYTAEEEAAIAAQAAAGSDAYFNRKASENSQDLSTAKSDLARLKGYATDNFATEMSKSNRSFALQMRQAANAYGARGLSGSGIFQGYATEQAEGLKETQNATKTTLDRSVDDYLAKSKAAETTASRALQDLGRTQTAQRESDIQKIKDSRAAADYNAILLRDRAPNLNGGTYAAAIAALKK